MILVHLLEGGSNSGNYNHAGRPGEVGGSSHGVTVFHGTEEKFLEKIKKEGLLPQPPENRSFKRPPDQDILYSGERGQAVFLTDNFEDAQTWIGRRINNRGGIPMILEVTVPEESLKDDECGNWDEDREGSAYYVVGGIKPENIKAYYKYDMRGGVKRIPLRESKEKTYYACVLILN